MSDNEPRRSGRATKGQHKHASASPAPAPKPTKTAKSKPPKKSLEPEPEDDETGEEEEIRCVCGNSNPKDRRAFIGCDACTVWQHNVCMGITDDEDDVPDHYFCEQCRPEEHEETVNALERGEKIWETRNKIYQNEKKMSKNRKGKATTAQGWLKNELTEPADDGLDDAEETQETGSKRKREEVKEESVQETEEAKPTRATRQDKRRKSSAPEERVVPDVESALVQIDKLPSDRQKIATALSKIIADAIGELSKAGFGVPDGETAKSIGDKQASLIEYELQMVHEGPSNPTYMAQFRALNANLKRNRVLVERILKGSLTSNELATMESKDMASEELQKERATMKEQLDRQAVAIQENEGPRYRRTHKGDELIEDENQHLKTVTATATAQPVRERVVSEGEDAAAKSPPLNDAPQEQAGSPMRVDSQTPVVDASRASARHERRQSSQNFDMNNIWAKTAGSPTNASSGRRMPLPHRRQSSINAGAQEQDGGTKDDADVDRMLQDDDEAGSPADGVTGDVIWRGKLIQSADGSQLTANARWVAGRDMSATCPWKDALPKQFTIDGRLQIAKAEEYLCSLQYSASSDVTILALTPYDDADAFSAVFQYFKSRGRYAVVNKDKPPMVRDIYIIPVEAGAQLPDHLGLLVHCTLKAPVEEDTLLVTLVMARDPGDSQLSHPAPDGLNSSNLPPSNGHHLPQHVLSNGPAGSPVTTQSGVFSPANNPGQQPPPSYSGIPPNPYTPTPPPSQTQPQQQQAGLTPHPNPLVGEILGTLQFAPTAQQILLHQPDIDRDRLMNLKTIMEDDPSTRTDIQALGRRLQI